MSKRITKSFIFSATLGIILIGNTLGQNCKAVECSATVVNEGTPNEQKCVAVGLFLKTPAECKRELRNRTHTNHQKITGWCVSKAACEQAEADNMACPSE